jgi:predicted aminopeptidase
LKRISNTKYLKDQSNEAQNGEKKWNESTLLRDESQSERTYRERQKKFFKDMKRNRNQSRTKLYGKASRSSPEQSRVRLATTVSPS